MSHEQQENYRLFALGSNGSGQLGIGHTDDVSAPQECIFGSTSRSGNIRQLAAGGNHTLMLYEDGNLYSTGDNSDGRCRGKDSRQTYQWQFAFAPHSNTAEPNSALHIASTWSASMASSVNKFGIMSVGSGTTGELGLGPDVVNSPEPQLSTDFMAFGITITKLASCMGHVVAVLSNGKVWGWGKGRKGQLGEPCENVWSPRKIDGIPFFAVDAVCGKDFTCVFGPSNLGQFVILGSSGKDRFGIRANAPSSIHGWKQVAASWGSIYVLMHSGAVVSWGRDDHGQLAPPGLPPLEAIAAGSEHCLGLQKAGKVLAWGWGEHGNCGIPTDESGDVKGRWNEIPVAHIATAVFAGCATSFIVAKMDRN